MDEVIKAYPEEQVKCDHEQWCYFITPCDKLYDRIPSLKFTFPTTVDGVTKQIKFEVSNRSLLFNDHDPRLNMPVCHLGIVKQTYNDVDHFILGQSFMENFYVTYDARDADKLMIGLSQDVPLDAPESSGHGGLIALVVILFVLAAIAAAGAIFYKCMQKRRQERLDKAKNYFETLKVKDEEQSGESKDLDAFTEDAPAIDEPAEEGS